MTVKMRSILFALLALVAFHVGPLEARRDFTCVVWFDHFDSAETMWSCGNPCYWIVSSASGDDGCWGENGCGPLENAERHIESCEATCDDENMFAMYGEEQGCFEWWFNASGEMPVCRCEIVWD